MRRFFYQFDDEAENFFRLFLEDPLPEFVDEAARQVEDVRCDVVRASAGHDRQSSLAKKNTINEAS